MSLIEKYLLKEKVTKATASTQSGKAKKEVDKIIDNLAEAAMQASKLDNPSKKKAINSIRDAIDTLKFIKNSI